MKPIQIILVLGISIIGVGPLAAEGWVCDADAQKLCHDKKPLSPCLIEHKDELSAHCKALFEKKPAPAAKPASSWLGACSDDAEKLCAGKRSISRCLIDHEDKLSAACGSLVASWNKQSAKSPSSWAEACSADAARLCAGKHSISLCMMEHKEEWSAGCKHSMTAAQPKKTH